MELNVNNMTKQKKNTQSKNIKNKKSQLWTIVAIIFCISVIVLLVMSPSTTSMAKTFDDDMYLFENSFVKNPGFATAWKFLSEVKTPSNVGIGGYYQPLSLISLMIDYAIAGSDTNLRVFHTTSLVIHTLNVIILFLILYALFRRPYIAGITAVLFGIHPTVVETITWIGERKTTLAAFFGFLSILMYINYKQKENKGYLAGTFAFYILSLMAKPTGTTLPVALLLFDIWPLKKIISKKTLWSSIKEKIPMFLISVISAIITYISQEKTASVTKPGVLEAIYKLCYNIVFYSLHAVFPHNLTIHYPVPSPISLSNPEILFGFIGTIILSIVTILSLRKTKAIFTGISAYYVLLFPVMGVIGFSNAIASHKYAYIPSVSLLILIAWFMIFVLERIDGLNKPIKKILLIGSTIVIVIISGLLVKITENWIAKWKDTPTLYTYMKGITPDAPPGYYGLGIYYAGIGDVQNAEANYLKALELYKNSVERQKGELSVYTNLGALYYNSGKDFDKAEEMYKKALLIYDKDPKIYFNLGLLYKETKKFDKAIENFNKCFEFMPGNLNITRNLAATYVEAEQPEKAIPILLDSLKKAPDNYDVIVDLADAFIFSGDFQNAKKFLSKALELNPSDEYVVNRAKTLYELEMSLKARSAP